MAENPFDEPLVQVELDKALRWVSASREILDGVDFLTTPRVRISCSYHRISMEHQTAILMLTQGQIMASAKALLRPQFDNFTRGVWFMEAATEGEIRDYHQKGVKSGVPPRYEVVFKALDAVERFETSFSDLHKKFLPLLHDFTHGGIHQVGAFNSRDNIESNFSPEDVIVTLRASATLGLLACNELAGNCQREDLSVRLGESHRAIYGLDHGKFDLEQGIVQSP